MTKLGGAGDHWRLLRPVHGFRAPAPALRLPLATFRPPLAAAGASTCLVTVGAGRFGPPAARPRVSRRLVLRRGTSRARPGLEVGSRRCLLEGGSPAPLLFHSPTGV